MSVFSTYRLHFLPSLSPNCAGFKSEKLGKLVSWVMQLIISMLSKLHTWAVEGMSFFVGFI